MRPQPTAGPRIAHGMTTTEACLIKFRRRLRMDDRVHPQAARGDHRRAFHIQTPTPLCHHATRSRFFPSPIPRFRHRLDCRRQLVDRPNPCRRPAAASSQDRPQDQARPDRLRRPRRLARRLFKQHGGFDIHATADYFQDQADKAGRCARRGQIPAVFRLVGLQEAARQRRGGGDRGQHPAVPRRARPAAIEAGCHVYAAKPVAIDVPGALKCRPPANSPPQRNSSIWSTIRCPPTR